MKPSNRTLTIYSVQEVLMILLFLCCAEVSNWESATHVLKSTFRLWPFCSVCKVFTFSKLFKFLLFVVINNSRKRKTENFLNLLSDVSEVWETTLWCDTNTSIKNVKRCTHKKSLVSYGVVCTRGVKQEDRLKHHWPISPNKIHVSQRHENKTWSRVKATVLAQWNAWH